MCVANSNEMIDYTQFKVEVTNSFTFFSISRPLCIYPFEINAMCAIKAIGICITSEHFNILAEVLSVDKEISYRQKKDNQSAEIEENDA